MFYRLLKFAFLGPFLRLLFRPWVSGAEYLPASGAAIIAGNHLSFADHFIMPLVVPRSVVFLAKSEYFTGRGLRGWLTAAFFRGAGQLPVDRSGGRAAGADLRVAQQVLAAGDLLGIYPEGTRSPDGRLYRGRIGVARLALSTQVPVIPCAMIGTHEVQPPGQAVPRIRRVGVRFGPPLDFSRYEGMESDRYVLRAVTDQIVYEIMRLSGQEYVDVYATKAKEDLAGTGGKGGKAAEAARDKLVRGRLAAGKLGRSRFGKGKGEGKGKPAEPERPDAGLAKAS